MPDRQAANTLVPAPQIRLHSFSLPAVAEKSAGLRTVTLSSTKIRLHRYLQLLKRMPGLRNVTLPSMTSALSPYKPPPQTSGDGSAQRRQRGSCYTIAPSLSNGRNQSARPNFEYGLKQ